MGPPPYAVAGGGVTLCPVTPPSPDGPLVGDLIASLEAEPPIHVEVVPHPRCREGECFPDVAALADAEGGEMVTGWCIWNLPGFHARAEHHAIWRRPDGRLVDPLPKRAGHTIILFVPDRLATWAGPGLPARRSVWAADGSSQDAVDLVKLLEFEEALEEAFRLTTDAGKARRLSAEMERVRGRQLSLYNKVAGSLRASV